MRKGLSDEYLEEEISSFWRSRSDRYSEIRTDSHKDRNRIEMSYIGG